MSVSGPDHSGSPAPYYFLYASFGPNLQPVNQLSMNWARVNAKSIQSSTFRNSNINPTDFPYVVVYNKDTSRLKAIGKGENQIMNHCGKGVTCSDAEHAVNRRTGFRFISTK